ncbi:potassium channel family protein [Halorientalis litorea]|uniref:potassium channel family protein n=1 Tax=Halorientalis litorea TaxID=2931977 RepID=UPI001FF18243|nr:NAD-binding protein [Halorientalis litorea]
MDTWQRRTAYYMLGLAAVILAYALAYHYAMTTWEGASQSFLHSLQIVVETFTTTGFGSDAPWETPQTNLLVIAMDLTGVALIFLALPVLLFPMFEEIITTTPPERVEDVSDHVIICAYTARVGQLIDELTALDVPFVVVEPDRDRAVELFEDDVPVIHGDPESEAALRGACLSDARALVADVDDSANASVVLTAGSIAPDVPLVTFVEDPDIASYHRYAGADTVFSPRQLIGESIANKVTTGVTAEVGDAVEIGEDFEIVELTVQPGSKIHGRRVDESNIRERTGANVIGAWFEGEFVTPPNPDAVLDEHSVLLVAGQEAQLERLREMTLSKDRAHRRDRVIVAGHGEVGSTVEKRLREDDIPSVVVDHTEMDGVDIVGDITDTEVLETAGIDAASTVILALSDDTNTVFATLAVRDVAPDVEIIARADETESVRKLYRAGADYVLALATVSGRMLASTILDEDIISLDQQVEIVRFDAGRLVGRTPAEADIRAETGCTVIAVERDGDVFTDIDPDFRFREGDDLIVAGPDESTTAFTTRYSE